MKQFYWLSVIIVALLFFAFAGILLYNTRPREFKDCLITINVVTGKNSKTTTNDVQISKSTLEDILRQSAYAARQEAQNEYDKNLSILLTILTIFGVAWPLVVAIAQYKFNEKEFDRIPAAERKAEEASNRVNEVAYLSLEMSYVIHTNQTIIMKEHGEDKKFPGRSNLNKLLAAYCKCMKKRFSCDGKWATEDVLGLERTVFDVIPEERVDGLSAINKFLVNFIINDIGSCIENMTDAALRIALGKILRKARELLDAYKQLVPDGSEADLNI